ncbi:hypothetical protein LRS13_13495 [Svornostia abyssi]|uniref:Uncharacterized protein n=1 Tax=Svornostia abyssi TaxID=2898438 RepID=A0ABY5PB34_9ACTN|nr:hypothetical protein LRS13_13495 [Parviterribacteraceae bacterium J379]
MTIANAVPHDQETIAAEFKAVADLLPALIDNPPSADAAPDVKAKALDLAIGEARRLLAFPGNATGPTGRRASAFLDALRAHNDAVPRAKQRVLEGPPPITAGIARLASDLAADPSAVDRTDPGIVAGLDASLGARLIAQYHADVEAAQERFAEGCDELLSRIPVDWRRIANAPTRAERIALSNIQNGLDA